VENDWVCPKCKSVSLCILNEYSDGVENVYKVECKDCNKKFFVSEKSK
jgi:transposase-like protein